MAERVDVEREIYEARPKYKQIKVNQRGKMFQRISRSRATHKSKVNGNKKEVCVRLRA